MYYSISPKIVRSFVLRMFGHLGEVVSSGKEFNMNSPFVKEDTKKKFWINLDTGLWRDFAGRRDGNIIQFYSWYYGVPEKEAETDLLFKSMYYAGEDKIETPVPLPHNRSIGAVFDNFTPVNYGTADSNYDLNIAALQFLESRKLLEFAYNSKMPIAYCEDPDSIYFNRIMIPFVDNDKVIYFQGRRAYNCMFPKYLNAKSDLIKSSYVLYPFDMTASYVVVTEGALDAIALQAQGVNATSTLSCHVSMIQFEQLREFKGKVILSFDNDPPGFEGIERAEELRTRMRMSELSVCFPPKGFKDWGEAHEVKYDLKSYIDLNTHPLDKLYLCSYGLFKEC